MRIALASIHPRALSGQIQQIIGLAQILERRGHAVSLVSPFPSEALLDPNRIRLAAHPQRIPLDQPSRITRILLHLRRIASQVDIIQLNLPTPAFSILADWLQISVRVPVVVGYEAHLIHLRDLLWSNRVLQAPSFYLPRLLVNNCLMARLTLRRIQHHVVSSHHQKDELYRLGVAQDRVHVLPPVLPVDKRMGSSNTMRALFPSGRIITYIGHYNHVKGVDVLLQAFQALLPSFPDLYLVLAWSGLGSNRLLDNLLKQPVLHGRIYQLGQVQVQDLLAASDLMVLPYRLTIGQAAFPAMLMEAQSALIPVVTTDLPLLRELTDGGKTAMLVAPEDAAALAQGIECVLTQPRRVAQMKLAQKRWAQQTEPESVVKEYERLYGHVIASEARVLRPAGDREHLP